MLEALCITNCQRHLISLLNRIQYSSFIIINLFQRVCIFTLRNVPCNVSRSNYLQHGMKTKLAFRVQDLMRWLNNIIIPNEYDLSRRSFCLPRIKTSDRGKRNVRRFSRFSVKFARPKLLRFKSDRNTPCPEANEIRVWSRLQLGCRGFPATKAPPL